MRASRALRATLKGRFDRVGIQTRIMLYVTVGLAAMFGGFAYLGFRAVGEATDLVYEERLSTAYTTAGIIERDLLHVARDVDEVFGAADPRPDSATGRLLTHLSRTDPFPFFRVTGVWVLPAAGGIPTAAGTPPLGGAEQIAAVAAAGAEMRDARYAAIPAVARAPDAVPFATIVVRPSRPAGLVVAVHAASLSTATSYVPTTYWQTAAGVAAASGAPAQPGYHMEVVGPDGVTVLAVGEDERPGEASRHLAAVEGIVARRDAAVIVHEPSPGETFAAHAMAVVPLGSSRFSLILEQPADVALSLRWTSAAP